VPKVYFILSAAVWIGAALLPSSWHASAGQNREFHAAGRKPEHVLAGIDISGKIDQVIAKYGKPDDVRMPKTDSAPEGSGDRNYVWRKGSTTISVTTGYYVDKSGKEIESDTYEVEVTGSSPEDEIGKTGAGLSLGDTREIANRVYGPHFYKSQVYKSPLRGDHVPVLAMEWENGTRLCIGFDKRERINFITLMASVD
jgi:hypothetical protein